MTHFIIGFMLGIFTGAFIANKKFRDRVIKEVKKLSQTRANKK